uniref:Uncharacterized protein n=1 Tax=Tanacetum cinerariifolium TaxID=118510 RepID=A0A699SLC5_TANCI|nr:hypothetical protein [Tanacetum cinerariifolium]
MSTLQTLIGSYYASNFIRFGQLYKVMVQAGPEYRTNPDDLLKLYVKNNRGELVPYSTFVRLERVYGPDQLTRYNMYTSAMVSSENAQPGHLHFRAGYRIRVPHSGGPVRELPAAAAGTSELAHGHFRGLPISENPRSRKQHLCAGSAGNAHRFAGQKRHPCY